MAAEAWDVHLTLLPELSSALQAHEKTGYRPHLAIVQEKEMTKNSSYRHFLRDYLTIKSKKCANFVKFVFGICLQIREKMDCKLLILYCI